MNSNMVKMIYQEASNLTVGQSLDVPVESKEHGFSFRTMFYRERKKYLDQGLHTDLVISTVKEVNGAWFATIECQKPLVLTLYKEDGTSQELSLDFGVTPIPEEDIPEDVIDILKKHRARKEEEDE